MANDKVDTKTDTISVSRKNRILTIDDDNDTGLSLKVVLERSGLFRVDVFDDPILALSNFKSDRYDVVILDVRMPAIDGFTLYKRIKKIDEKTKICFLTSVYDLDNYYRTLYSNVEDTIKENRDCIIDKPVGTEQLIKEINKLLCK
jgi:DNA-binding response OmpR family regulator